MAEKAASAGVEPLSGRHLRLDLGKVVAAEFYDVGSTTDADFGLTGV